MAIVTWTSKKYPIEISSGTERDQDLMVGILKLDTSKTGDPWSGKVTFKDPNRAYGKSGPATFIIELRKLIGSTNVLIRITTADRGITLSMNGTADFTIEQMNEMNLAILEGQNVLDNLVK